MANAKLDKLKKRRDELKRQVKRASDNRDKQKKSDRRRKRKKENSFAQLIPVFIAVLVVLIWCTMQDVLWAGSIELADVNYEQTNSAQSQFVAQYLSARAEALKTLPSGGGTKIDPAEMYADAAETCAGYSAASVVKDQYLVYSKNAPTYDMNAAGGTPYVVNIRSIYEQAVSDIIAVEKDVLGSTATYKEPSSYAMDIIAGGKWYQRYGKGDVDYLGHVGGTTDWNYTPGGDFGLHGSVGNAVMIRGWFTEEYWNKPDTAGGGIYWKSVGGKIVAKGAMKNKSVSEQSAVFNTNKKLNLMVVKQSDVEAYYTDPSSVEVWYIELTNFDSKSHSYPWGISQTWAKNDGGYMSATKTQADSPVVGKSAIPGGSSLDYWKTLVSTIKNNGEAVYEMNYIEQSFSNATYKSNALEKMNLIYLDNYIGCGGYLPTLLTTLGGGENMCLVGILVPGLDIPK